MQRLRKNKKQKSAIQNIMQLTEAEPLKIL